MAKRVILDPKLDTAAGAALREELLGAVGEDIVLDGSGVSLLGSNCLELMLGVAVIWRRDGHSLTIENASAQMIENLDRFGLTPELIAGGTS